MKIAILTAWGAISGLWWGALMSLTPKAPHPMIGTLWLFLLVMAIILAINAIIGAPLYLSKDLRRYVPYILIGTSLFETLTLA